MFFKVLNFMKVLNMDTFLVFLLFVHMVEAIFQILLSKDLIHYFGDYYKVGHVFI
jgi:hypothetical protein